MQFKNTFVGVTILTLAWSGSAFAHAHLSVAVPEPKATLATAPTQITIDFTEELEVKASSIRVEDSNGKEVDTADSHGDPSDAKRLIVGLKPLQPGTYKVIWKATATDTHKTNGTYEFKVAG